MFPLCGIFCPPHRHRRDLHEAGPRESHRPPFSPQALLRTRPISDLKFQISNPLRTRAPKALDCWENHSSQGARSARGQLSEHATLRNKPAEGLGLRKPAAAFPEPARWPGTTQALPLPTRSLPTSPSNFSLLTPFFPLPSPASAACFPLGPAAPHLRPTLRVAPTPETIQSIPSIRSIRSTRIPKTLTPTRPLIHSAPPITPPIRADPTRSRIASNHPLHLAPLAPPIRRDREAAGIANRPVQLWPRHLEAACPTLAPTETASSPRRHHSPVR